MQPDHEYAHDDTAREPELTVKRVRLWLEVDVHPELLIPAASEMSQAMWNSKIEDLASDLPIEVQALFEAIFGSTPGPHPDWLYVEDAGINYGGEIIEAEPREERSYIYRAIE